MKSRRGDKPPFPKSWWVVPRRFLAGCYPGSPDAETASRKLSALLATGIETVISLQEPNEVGADGRPFAPYEPTLQALAAERGATARCLNFPIRDMGTTDAGRMRRIVDAIDEAMATGRGVYVHCWGGHGRTGIVVGCWLAEHGFRGTAALGRLSVLRRGDPELAYWSSPQTDEQREFVLDWPVAEAGGPGGPVG